MMASQRAGGMRRRRVDGNKNLCGEIASLKKRKKRNSASVVHLQLCHVFFSLFSSYSSPPGMPFVLQSFGSSTTCRSQEADGMANFRGQIIQ